MSNGGFVIPTEEHRSLVQEVVEAGYSYRPRAVKDPTHLLWWNVPREELPEEWGDAEIAIWEAEKEKRHQQWLRFKKMKDEGNAPQSAAEMCAFLFGEEDDDE